jgi:hypothetical protein
MKRSDLNKWISALRSGDYEQGIGNLCCNDKFCCLGVFLDVVKEPYQIREVKNLDKKYRTYGDNGCEAVMPTAIAEKYGFYSGLGVAFNHSYTPLYQLNDKDKKTFSEIADILEAKPEIYLKIEE